MAALSVEVWMTTYAQDGVNKLYAEYALSTFTPKAFTDWFENPNQKIFVAETDVGVVGYLRLDGNATLPSHKGAVFIIQTLYVKESFTGKGLGQKLMKEAIRYCAQQGGRSLQLHVLYSNKRAIAFYENVKFGVIGETYFELGEERHLNYVMERLIEKNLQPKQEKVLFPAYN